MAGQGKLRQRSSARTNSFRGSRDSFATWEKSQIILSLSNEGNAEMRSRRRAKQPSPLELEAQRWPSNGLLTIVGGP